MFYISILRRYSIKEFKRQWLKSFVQITNEKVSYIAYNAIGEISADILRKKEQILIFFPPQEASELQDFNQTEPFYLTTIITPNYLYYKRIFLCISQSCTCVWLVIAARHDDCRSPFAV